MYVFLCYNINFRLMVVKSLLFIAVSILKRCLSKLRALEGIHLVQLSIAQMEQPDNACLILLKLLIHIFIIKAFALNNRLLNLLDELVDDGGGIHSLLFLLSYCCCSILIQFFQSIFSIIFFLMRGILFFFWNLLLLNE